MTIKEQVKEVNLLIEEFGITKNGIANKIGMNPSTFKLRLSGYFGGRTFTPEEMGKIRKVFQELSEKCFQIANPKIEFATA